LGTCLAFWVSELFDLSIALVDMEDKVATHASSRNTGVVHRPFYMNPEKKRRFAWAANTSFGMWERLSKEYSLPWRQTGIVEVSTDDRSLHVLDDYVRWAGLNGMKEDEVELLDPSQVHAIEPIVKCNGAILSKTDAAVDFRKFTQCVLALAQENGVTFISGVKLRQATFMNEGDTVLDVENRRDSSRFRLDCRLLINATGGGALRLAHSMGLAKEFAELHFRGDYWKVVDPSISSRVSHSIYSVPKHTEYPFLDPHLILRQSGGVEIGPNAAMVAGPYVYDGFTGGASQFASELVERPFSPKLRLFLDPGFLSLAWDEWRRSISKKAMCERVREFVPALNRRMLGSKGAGGVRNSLVDGQGFVPEVVEAWSRSSLHILNYNSPGATGAPAFSAQLVSGLIDKGYLKNGRRAGVSPHRHLWNFEAASILD
jgi:(S)-2-hydroxyglutarate dehydrogenase